MYRYGYSAAAAFFKIVLDPDATSGPILNEESGGAMRGYRVTEFAGLAGVTVRALHHYDRLAVLRPRRTESGYRVYSLRDLERLEQIVALKFLGLPLKEIKILLDREARRLPEVLRSQRLALEEKRRSLDQAIHAIRDAEQAIASGKPANVEVLTKIIEVIEMQEKTEFMDKYYSEEAQAKLAGKRKEWNPELQAETTRAWNELFRDVEAALEEDPASEKAQALAARWRKLLEGFTGGDPEVSRGIGKAWADRANWPATVKEQSAPFVNPKVWEFIEKAMGSCQG
jgi:DNA-binding transcriptional MerR regulator